MAVPYPKPEPKPKKKYAGLKRTPIKKKISKKQQIAIKTSKEYYENAILNNQKKNKGLCYCENCGDLIKFPTGSNVSHIISKGTNISLYFDMENHFILCSTCEYEWTNGSRRKMKIYPLSEQIKTKLTHQYYDR